MSAVFEGSDERPEFKEPEIKVPQKKKRNTDWVFPTVVVAVILAVIAGFVFGAIAYNRHTDVRWGNQCLSIGGNPSKVSGTRICVMADGTFISER
jgi:hypothetical protein